MKKIFSAILAGVVLSSLATAVSAHIDATNIGEVPAVPAGSITIDGFMDEAVWADALTVEINQLNLGSEDGAQGTAKMLWSEDTWYIFYDVKDADVQVSDPEIQQNTPWSTDSVEMFFDFTNEHAADVYQFRVDYSGWPSYYLNQSGDEHAYGPDAAPYIGDFKVQLDADGYNVEMAINVAKYGLKMGDSIGIQLQINDVTADSPTACANVHNMNQSMGAGSWDADLYDYITLGAELVVEEPVVDEPAVDAPVDAPATEAPVTADAGIVAAAAVMAVAAGVVLSKKH